MEVLDRLSAHVGVRKSSAGKSRASPSAFQEKPDHPSDDTVLTNALKTSPRDAKPLGSSAKASNPLPVPPDSRQKTASENGHISRQPSAAAIPSTEESLSKRPSLKRKMDTSSKQPDTVEGNRDRELPAVPPRLLAERVNGFGRAESGELPQDTGITSTSLAGKPMPWLLLPSKVPDSDLNVYFVSAY